MQRATPVSPSAPSVPHPAETACPVCGTAVSGIGAVQPGEHRFVDCGHYASARFLRGERVAADGSRRLGP